jgi:hypothetical protein
VSKNQSQKDLAHLNEKAKFNFNIGVSKKEVKTLDMIFNSKSHDFSFFFRFKVFGCFFHKKITGIPAII